MSGFIEGENRHQTTLFPERIDDYVGEDSVVRVIDVFIDRLDISGLGFKAEAADTGRPGYHPRTLLKIYVYGYLNQVHSSRRLEREAQRNVGLMWLTGRLAPDFKTIADFRKDNGEAHRIEAYVPNSKTSHNKAKGLFDRSEFNYIAEDDEYECPAGERLIYRFTRTEGGKRIRRYWSSVCGRCSRKSECTTGKQRRVSRWEHEDVIERAEARLSEMPEAMQIRRSVAKHPYGTIKHWMGATHFLTKTRGKSVPR